MEESSTQARRPQAWGDAGPARTLLRGMDSPAAFSRFTSIKPSLAGLPAHTLSWNGCGQAFWQRPVRISLLAFIPLVRRGWSAAGLEEHCPKRADHPPGHALSGRIL